MDASNEHGVGVLPPAKKEGLRTSSTTAEFRKSVLDVLYDGVFKENAVVDVITLLRTTERICRNVLEHPEEEKYRRLRKRNKVFREKVERMKHGEELLRALDFHVRVLDMEEVYVFSGSPEHLREAVELLDKYAFIYADKLARQAELRMTKDERRKAEREDILRDIAEDKVERRRDLERQEARTRALAQAEVEAKARAQAQAQAEAEAKARVQSQAEAEAKARVQTRAEVGATAQVQAQGKAHAPTE